MRQSLLPEACAAAEYAPEVTGSATCAIATCLSTLQTQTLESMAGPLSDDESLVSTIIGEDAAAEAGGPNREAEAEGSGSDDSQSDSEGSSLYRSVSSSSESGMPSQPQSRTCSIQSHPVVSLSQDMDATSPQSQRTPA